MLQMAYIAWYFNTYYQISSFNFVVSGLISTIDVETWEQVIVESRD
jgi:hypothetical protein